MSTTAVLARMTWAGALHVRGVEDLSYFSGQGPRTGVGGRRTQYGRDVVTFRPDQARHTRTSA